MAIVQCYEIPGLFSTWYSGGGKFLCTVTAVVTDQPTTTTPAPPDNCDCGWRQEVKFFFILRSLKVIITTQTLRVMLKRVH